MPLSEKDNLELDGIISKMISNKESDEDIKYIIDDYISFKTPKKDLFKPVKDLVNDQIIDPWSKIFNAQKNQDIIDNPPSRTQSEPFMRPLTPFEQEAGSIRQPTGKQQEPIQNVVPQEQISSEVYPNESLAQVGAENKGQLAEFGKAVNDLKNIGLDKLQGIVKDSRALDKKFGVKQNAIMGGFVDSLTRMPPEDQMQVKGVLDKVGYVAGQLGGGVTEFAALMALLPELPLVQKLPVAGLWISSAIRNTGALGASMLIDELAQKDPSIQGYKERFKEATPYILALNIAPYMSGLRNIKPGELTLMKELVGRGEKFGLGAAIATGTALTQGKSLTDSLLIGAEAGAFTALTGAEMNKAGVPLAKKPLNEINATELPPKTPPINEEVPPRRPAPSEAYAEPTGKASPSKESTLPTLYDIKDANDIIGSRTHYKSGENYFPRAPWAHWFQGRDASSKPRIVMEILDDKKTRDAMLSNMYHIYQRDNDFKGSFEEFLQTPIKIYRGEQTSDTKGLESKGFDAFTSTKEQAEIWAKGGTGKVIEKTIKPIDTYGSVDYIMGSEVEILVPNKLPESFVRELVLDKMNQTYSQYSDSQLEEIKDLIDKKDYAAAAKYIGLKIELEKPTASTGKASPSKESTLMAEARKYKTAEEFVKAKTIVPISEDAVYGGQDMAWRETMDRPKKLQNDIIGYHYSDSKIEKFFPKETAFFVDERGSGKYKYSVKIPKGTTVQYSTTGEEVRVDLDNYRNLELKLIQITEKKLTDELQKDRFGGYTRKFIYNNTDVNKQLIDIWNEAHATKPSDFKVPKGGKTEVQSTLRQEALKYATAEEFVAAQGEPLYHGTTAQFDNFNEGKVHLTTRKDMAEFYSTSPITGTMDSGTGRVIEAYANLKNPLIIESKQDYENSPIPDMTRRGITSLSEQNKELEKLGYDGMINKWSHKQEVIVFDSKNVKTKAQLIDIWNEAHKTKPSDFKVPKGGKTQYSFSDYNTDKIPDYPMRIQLPEMLTILREMGNLPVKIRELVGRNVNIPGAYTPNSKITLKAELAKNPEMAARVFAHELFHYIDYMPEGKTTDDLLGKLSGIKSGYHEMIKNDPLSTSKIISPEDMLRLQQEAEQMGLQGETYVVEEPIYEDINVTPEEIKAIWNDVNSKEKYPLLFDYIAKLSGTEKKQILLQAFKGVVAESLKGLGKTQIGVKQVTKTRVGKKSKAEIKKLFEELLIKEIEARKLYTLEQVKAEMRALSFYWRPIPDNADEGYLKYRERPNELYADMGSALMNDPETFLKMAPKTFELFFNYLDSKPAFKKAFFGLMDKLSNMNLDQLMELRDMGLRQGFKDAETQFLIKEKLKKQAENTFDAFKFNFIDRNSKIIDLAKKDFREGKVANPDSNLLYQLNELPYYAADVSNILNKLNPYRNAYLKAGGSDEDFGAMLFYHRIAFGDRGELFNPGAVGIKEARTQLERYKRTFSPEKYDTLTKAVYALRDIFKEDVIKPAINIIKKELYDKLMASDTVYAGFITVNHIIDDFVGAEFHHQVGTVDDIANPFAAVILKTLAIRKATMVNDFRLELVKQLLKYHSDEIEVAKVAQGGFVKSKTGLEPIIYKLEGVRKAILVDPWITRALVNQPSSVGTFIQNTLGVVNKYFRYSYVVFNVGFQGFNFVRDFLRTWKNLPGMTFADLIVRYIKAVPTATRRAFGIDDDLISEMYRNKALLLTYNDYILADNNEFSEAERLLTQFNVIPKKTKDNIIILKQIADVFNFIKKTGDVIETLPKAVGYKYLKELGWSDREAAEFTRKYIGTPDIKIGGDAIKIYNNIWLFSRVIINGYLADLELATQKTNRGTRHGTWIKGSMMIVLPILMMLYFKKKYEDWYNRQTEYQKSNYILIPLPESLEQLVSGEGQNTWNTLRIPFPETDRLAHAILWKSMSVTEHPDLGKALGDIFSLGAGQLPNLSPALKVGGGIMSATTGQNIYDPFYQRLIFSDDQMKAAAIYRVEPLTKWVVQQTGVWPLTIWAKSGNSVSQKPWYEDKLKVLPIVGRWILDPNGKGINEKLYDAGRVQASREAAARIEKGKDYIKYVENIRQGKDSVSSAYKQFLSENYAGQTMTKQKQTSIMTNFLKNVYRGLGNENALPLINASTIEQKMVITKRMVELLGLQETNKTILDLLAIKAISMETYTKLNRILTIMKKRGGG